MRKSKVRLLSLILSFCLALSFLPITVSAELEIEAPSVILIEAMTKTVLYEKDSEIRRHPASVTKVMTLLLVYEALSSGKIKLDEKVSISDDAAGMGGSQIYLEVGELMTVEDLIKSVVICSANDAAVALAEHVAGSESAFVDMMNAKAQALGMKNTHFDNTNGLDDTTDTHLTTAKDIAIMSRELIVNHPEVLEYTTIWQDTVRDGEFTLTNTNKLIRFYSGANGLKTGFTSKSGYCISACAKRDGMQLIAVIMGAETSDKRNVTAKRLFDYGFANYEFVEFEAEENIPITISSGIKGSSSAQSEPFFCVTKKGTAADIEQIREISQSVPAPVKKGDVVGRVVYKSNGEEIGSTDITASENVDKISYFALLKMIFKKYFMF